eukprot:TRINITY_DN690_c0_g2_i1.p1 TRINITY_DN690_c0_g2~~TRINITY_DN690_c0_g2_i1.p1  ORF type:complete len:1106 (+),score=228.82 TRINITY_DN690_c0_g2_i1:177-3320(+)
MAGTNSAGSGGSPVLGHAPTTSSRGSINIEFVLPASSSNPSSSLVSCSSSSDERLILLCPLNWRIADLKLNLFHALGSRLPIPTSKKTVSDVYTLRVLGTCTYLDDDQDSILLYKSPVIKFCYQKKFIPLLGIVLREDVPPQKLMALQISNIISRGDAIKPFEDSDASDFRLRVARKIASGWGWGARWQPRYVPALPAELASVNTNLQHANVNEFHVKIHSVISSGDDMVKTVVCHGDWLVSQLMEHVRSKSRNFLGDEFVFKISGREQYLIHDVAVGSFAYIQDCLKRDRTPALSLAKKSSAPAFEEPPEDVPESLFPSISANSGAALTAGLAKYGDRDVVSILEIKRPLELQIVSVRGLHKYAALCESGKGSALCTVEIGIYHGGKLIAKPLFTQPQPLAQEIFWNEWLRTDVKMSEIPEESRVCVTLWANREPLANVSCRLFDYKDHFLSGELAYKMWPEGKANPIGTCVENLLTHNPPIVRLRFPSFPQPVAYPTLLPAAGYQEHPTPSASVEETLVSIIRRHPLYPLSNEDKGLLWEYREFCRREPRSLVKILQCVDWCSVATVQETYRLLNTWEELNPVDALELLDAKFANQKVRDFAVKCLHKLSDSLLKDCLLQLVQVLKYEPHHYSSLACWLLKRALRNPMVIGHYFFWHLQAEMHVVEISERFGLLLEVYLHNCGEQRADLSNQLEVIKGFKSVATIVKDTPMSRRKQVIQQQLENMHFPERFQLPLDPTWAACKPVVSKCKSMDSAKAPLWLVFENADPKGDNIIVMFKSGDDLRQDILTLQMLNIMDKMWKKAGLDLHLTPYGCVSTGEEMGLIEICLGAETTAHIQKEAGGIPSLSAIFRATPLDNWIRTKNPKTYEQAVSRFTHSCAGYCVATFVLGIGDRHNDNIMVNERGFLFHIDFGHFLGNFKKFAGVRREHAPFVLTPEFAHVMGGKDSENFHFFIDLCCRGYNVLRLHANIFINLFAMMLSTGIPELKSEEDIEYLSTALSLNLTDEEAKKAFTKLIYESLTTKATQFNFAIHLLAHPSKEKETKSS